MAYLLDLTRLVSRLGRGVLTGVDRVELAYLDRLLAGPLPFYGLVRTGLGFVLLDAAGCRALRALVVGAEPLGPWDLLGRLTRRGDPARARAEATLRRLARARCARPLLGRMLRRHLPGGLRYLNVGHANLAHRVMAAVKSLPGARANVLVHDTIPLDHPEFSRSGIPAVFGRKLAVVAAHADLVIYSTQDARARAEAHLARLGRVPAAVVAALGVPVALPDAAAVPAGLMPTRPYFVVIGTIEPRKNHALLLEVWQKLAARLPAKALPDLLVLGGRGWVDAALLARLDARPAGVLEAAGLSDAAVAALLQRAVALLFPSHAEGFGLPAVEAMALGVPVICSDLAVFREILGNYPVYLKPDDSYSWLETITRQVLGGGLVEAGRRGQAVPTWDAHFNAVLNLD